MTSVVRRRIVDLYGLYARPMLREQLMHSQKWTMAKICQAIPQHPYLLSSAVASSFDSRVSDRMRTLMRHTQIYAHSLPHVDETPRPTSQIVAFPRPIQTVSHAKAASTKIKADSHPIVLKKSNQENSHTNTRGYRLA